MRTDLPADGPDLFETVRVVSPWDYLQRARMSLASSEPVAAFRNWLKEGDRLLEARFLADEQVEDLVSDRARLVDLLLTKAWERHLPDDRVDLCLVAVGGYGRGELLPHSDIDIMILLPKTGAERWTSQLEGFLTFLWDIGLEVGHSVRTVDECKDEALADISVATTLIEARLLAGPDSLFTAMRRAIAPDRIWSSADFFEAKLAEQVQRHHRYHDTAYNLEPNVKQSPGGLRDIQTVAWVAKRHFGADTLDELVQHGFLTQRELVQLKAAQAYLWRVRFALHLLTGRREDRILFDHQIKLARQFGYEDATFTLAVEQFMQRYYRTAMFVSLTNELLLQHFREAILASGDARPVPISPLFQEREEYLEVTSPDVFVRNPSALLELFVILQNNPQLRGVRAGTIRLVTRHLWLIDEEFRQNPRNHRLFLEI
ncbi:MAG: nucleotidyltransferase domain-containing protein, partial [Steroidobacteraceae bacterium]